MCCLPCVENRSIVGITKTGVPCLGCAKYTGEVKLSECVKIYQGNFALLPPWVLFGCAFHTDCLFLSCLSLYCILQVVYPKYEEAFRLGLAAFSNPMRTNKFKRDLPPIFGTPEFLCHPNSGINPLPTSEAVIQGGEENASAEEVLNSDLTIGAYGSNGEIPDEATNNQVGPGFNSAVTTSGPSLSKSDPGKITTEDMVIDTSSGKGCTRGTFKAASQKTHSKKVSLGASVVLYSSSSSGSPDSPTPSLERMGMSRYTTPIRDQLEEIRIQNANAKSQQPSQRTLSLSFSGYAISSQSSLEKMLAGELEGGLFDTDEDLTQELLKMSLSSQTGRSENRTTASVNEEVSSADVPEPAVPVSTEHETEASDLSNSDIGDDLEIMQRVYETILQWQNSSAHSSESPF